jgi:hypothetical protein
VREKYCWLVADKPSEQGGKWSGHLRCVTLARKYLKKSGNYYTTAKEMRLFGMKLHMKLWKCSSQNENDQDIFDVSHLQESIWKSQVTITQQQKRWDSLEWNYIWNYFKWQQCR